MARALDFQAMFPGLNLLLTLFYYHAFMEFHFDGPQFNSTALRT